MLQNRVNPWGELCKVGARGTLMGNRGHLHNEKQEIVRRWQRVAWVTCELEFGERRRPKPFSTMDNYSELFFLDEATAFAAGHRPCTTCRRERSNAFKTAWVMANTPGRSAMALADIDKVLQKERATASGDKVMYEARVGDLPVGTMVALDALAYVLIARGLLPWSFAGYGALKQVSAEHLVEVLTPRSVVNAFRQGFKPEFHDSARAWLGCD